VEQSVTQGVANPKEHAWGTRLGNKAGEQSVTQGVANPEEHAWGTNLGNNR